MTTYTNLEMNILNILADNHKNDSDYDGNWQTENGRCAHLDTWELTVDGTRKCGTIFTKYNLDPKVYRGVISSLIQKEAIDMDEYETTVITTKGHIVDVDMVAIAITEKTFDELVK
tara:strand:- start:1094 stop:1441 length:348 start_codon:yes stop_codon:yes gene_type:complete